jgi:phenylpyruvate tautomerase PptA (4-oxalocrotonate tautomerase family)
MPIVTVSMYSGITQREKDRLTEAITEDKDIKCRER